MQNWPYGKSFIIASVKMIFDEKNNKQIYWGTKSNYWEDKESMTSQTNNKRLKLNFLKRW